MTMWSLLSGSILIAYSLEKMILESQPLSDTLRTFTCVTSIVNTSQAHLLQEELNSLHYETSSDGVDGLLGTLLEHPPKKMVKAIVRRWCVWPKLVLPGPKVEALRFLGYWDLGYVRWEAAGSRYFSLLLVLLLGYLQYCGTDVFIALRDLDWENTVSLEYNNIYMSWLLIPWSPGGVVRSPRLPMYDCWLSIHYTDNHTLWIEKQ